MLERLENAIPVPLPFNEITGTDVTFPKSANYEMDIRILFKYETCSCDAKGSVLVDSISPNDFSKFRYCFEIAFPTFGDVHPFDIIAAYVACCVLCI